MRNELHWIIGIGYCTVGNTNNTMYAWAFTAKYGGQSVTLLGPFSFGTSSYQYGTEGVFFALIIILGLGALYLTKNIIASFILADLGIVICAILGLLNIPLPILGALQLLIALVIWLVPR